MKRAILLAIGAATVAAAAIPTLVSAQGGFPPPPPTTFFGKAPLGVSPGDVVIAIVVDGSASQVCGDGIVVPDEGISYVVDVAADGQIAGCGKAGRTVRFYFVGAKALANDVGQWISAGPAPQNLNGGGLAAPVTARNRLPHVAKDGVN